MGLDVLLYRKGQKEYRGLLFEENDENNDYHSIIILKTNLGIFRGDAYCNPEDVYSRFLGCQIAETRAREKFLKALIKQLRIRNDGIGSVKQTIKKYKPVAKMNRKERKMYNLIKEKYQELAEDIQDLEKDIKESSQKIDEKINYRIGLIKKLEDSNKKIKE